MLKMRKSLWILAVLVVTIGAPNAHAGTIETYTGNPYTAIPVPSSGYTTANFITARLVFANPLPANATLVDGAGGIGPPTATDPLLALVLSDGRVKYNLSDTINVWLVTGNHGQIIDWFVGACSPCSNSIAITTNFGLPPPFSPVGFDGSSQDSFGTVLAYNSGDPGTWAVSSTPEASSLLLFGTSLLGLVPFRRKLFGR
jgi:hypothetical protein